MLKFPLLHPQILHALAAAGHGAQVLIADANYPFSTGARPSVPRVFLNLAPGLLRVTDVLGVLTTSVAIEAAAVMVPESGPDPEIFAEFVAMLPSVPLAKLGRFEFYEQALGPNVALLIATAEERLYANVLLTIGVVRSPVLRFASPA